MPAKAKVTKDVLIDIAKNLYLPDTAAELAERHNLLENKIERLASRLRKAGATVPKRPELFA